jgi:hypothetical protein
MPLCTPKIARSLRCPRVAGSGYVQLVPTFVELDGLNWRREGGVGDFSEATLGGSGAGHGVNAVRGEENDPGVVPISSEFSCIAGQP